MNTWIRGVRLGVAAGLLSLTAAFGIGASAAADDIALQSDAEAAGRLGLLLGDGDGLTRDYLEKKSTRLQAALLSLRLTGKLDEAMDYEPTSNFSDKDSVSVGNQAVLGYLKEHPELGWQGPGDGTFDPLSVINSQQFYKVMLEALGYTSGADFAYADTEAFAASKGLVGIRGVGELTNAHLATALVESLGATTSDGGTLLASLQASGVVSAEAALPTGKRLALANDPELGAVLTDSEGRTLYFFTKDIADLNSCQGGCLTNWPIFYEDELIIPATLNADDFGAFTRSDGEKQLTYKGWPLYTFAKDAAAGDTNGEGANGVWFVAKPDYAVMIGTSAEHGDYITDAYGNALYYFAKDAPNASACAGPCVANWPLFMAHGALPSTLSAGDFGMIDHPEGGVVTTFKSYPLYYFAKDAAWGDTLGQNVNDVWFLVSPKTFEGTSAGAGTGSSSNAGAQQGKTYNVDIREFSFGSGPLTVEAGSTVVFTNYDDMEHNAVAANGEFSTPLLKKGESFAITLNEAGTYEYFCEPHKRFMTGTIIVK
ncbi:plastocyanin/azurin family copper-binding protein [Paenibacillus sp.]|uniref:plastocyanin/azurin family copper-binding protein n=1 Tax=Paenibacillus sp. TaxID=58172 RepID=UPI002811F2B4|nr:plastocyanin/azurin family copper-binding protein [Paenibacillus sp.]